MPNPRFPIYIVSKGRADLSFTAHGLNRMRVPYRIVIEEADWDAYAAVHGPEKLLILDPAYQANYVTADDLGDTKSKGPGPARNFAWEHSIAEGHDWHWVMDDNITGFWRLHKNRKVPCADGTPLAAMETFASRYSNVAMAGPHYFMFAPARNRMPPFSTGTRIYSCNLIRNSVPLRWECRYNEDTDLSLRMLKAEWATVLFNAFLCGKLTTQQIDGGNTEAFYDAEGTLPKSRMLVERHPDVARLTKRWGRWHHHVDYSPWRGQALVRDPNWVDPGYTWDMELRPAAVSYLIPGSFPDGAALHRKIAQLAAQEDQ